MSCPLQERRRGMVLILVLVVIALLTFACFTFSRLMLTARKATHLSGRQVQARALADSGVEMARLFLAMDRETQDELGSWYDNPTLFQMRLVVSDMRSVVSDEKAWDPGRFTIIAPNQQDGLFQGIRFGLEDESTRLNLNFLAAAEKQYQTDVMPILLKLPGMTEEIAEAILDWIDEDDERREFGAESDYYSALQPAYAPKNGPLQTIEELLLVRGVTPQLLFGADANRNGFLDADEPDGQNLGEEVDNFDGSMNRGWSAYLTLYGREANLDPDGEAKIDLNQDDMESLYEQLEEVLDSEEATFIVAYRQNGPHTGSEPSVKVLSGELDLTQQGQTKLKTVLDVIGAKVSVTLRGAPRPTILESPFSTESGEMDDYVPTLMDYCTLDAAEAIPGRININQAPRTVLAAIPGLSEEAVGKILAERQPNPAAAEPERRHATWILSDGIVTLDEMKTLMPFVTGGGSVYRAQVIGYFDRGGPAVRIEAVLDATTQPAQMVSFRDLSRLGRGYDLAILGIEDSATLLSGYNAP